MARVARHLGLALSFGCLAGVDADHHGGCTAGRLFISGMDEAVLHVYDLDDGMVAEVARDLPAAKPAMRLYATHSDAARVVAVWRGDAASNYSGVTQFYRSGITLDDHGDHSDIVKEAPRKYDFELETTSPTHITSSSGYIAIFNDGYWQAGGGSAVVGSSASFVREAELGDGSVTGSVSETRVPIAGGAHHGVAWAMAEDAFLVSLPVASRANFTDGASALPDGFEVRNAAGDLLHDLNDPASPPCPGMHGAALVGQTVAFGCASRGLYQVTYDAAANAAQRLSQVHTAYPDPDSTVPGYRSGAVEGSEAANLFVGTLYDAATSRAPLSERPPSYLFSTQPRAAAASTKQLLETSGSCGWAIDRAARSGGDGAYVAVLNPNGTITVGHFAGDGSAGGARLFELGIGALECSDYSLVEGVGHIFVLDRAASKLHILDPEKAYNGEEGAFATHALPFRPSGAALSLPSSAACLRSESSPTTPTSVAVGGGASRWAVLLVVARLWALRV